MKPGIENINPNQSDPCKLSGPKRHPSLIPIERNSQRISIILVRFASLILYETRIPAQITAEKIIIIIRNPMKVNKKIF